MSRSIILLALSIFDEIGGLQQFNQRVVNTLLSGADGEPPSLIVISLRDRTARHLGAGCTFIPCAGSRAMMIAAAARTLMSTAPAAVLFAHINLAILSPMVRLLRPSTRTALFVHGIEVWNTPEARRRSWYEPALIRLCIDKVMAVSRFTESVMRRVYGLSDMCFRLQPNAVDVIRPAVRGDRPPGFRLLTVSRLDEAYKGVGQIIAALVRLKRIWPEISLHVVGRGRLVPELRALAVALGVDNIVTFRGEISAEDLNEAYAAADLFVLPSRKEGFGIVFLEAWQHGLAVVCGNVDASPEVVSDGVTGLVVDPDDVGQLCVAIDRLMGDPVLARDMARRGYAELTNKYSGAIFVKTLRANLAALISGRAE